MLRNRNTKIIATLGPASDSLEAIETLFHSGADLFSLNFSHGTQEKHKETDDLIRQIEVKHNRPVGIIADLQGPKLRVGVFENGEVTLTKGQKFKLDMDKTPGNQSRVCLPHPEIFQALHQDAQLLLDDGKIELRVLSFDDKQAITEVIRPGILGNKKGLNVPHIKLPISALTEKDLDDLNFALNIGVDFIALSFVQTVEDVLQAREIIQNRAAIASKIEKPKALEGLEAIIEASDCIMIARGDLGVELPTEDVPVIQRKIIKSCRKAGRPVIVATQMLESMINCPTPTRAEASDVATAVYDAVDAVMLSAESASGQFPFEAVKIMDRIIRRTEADPTYREQRQAEITLRPQTITDSIAAAAHMVSKTIPIQCIVTFSERGFTTLRVARERPLSPILSLTPNVSTVRRMTLVWGAHATLVGHVYSFSHMVSLACMTAKAEGLAKNGQHIIVTAGVPFGEAGGTNILRVAQIGAADTE